MQLKLHNSLSGQKEPFRPANPERVTMYVCGPTVYGHVHIGNGRPAVVFDVLCRLLRALHPKVKYVCNITDVDDKINRQALAEGKPIQAFAERHAQAYNEDVKALGVLPPDAQPRATEHIAEILAMIETLIAKGFAYQAEGHVLFHVPADPAYGSLSKRSLADMLDGARVEVAPYKKDPKDFVLWKPSGPELPGWASPWGRGRPGWHIECSAMIRQHLGTSIDIHGGGADLAFPHHENESAQSRCASGEAQCVRYWLHNGMLTLGAEKMSKSLGNIQTIRNLLGRYDGETLRYALLCGQYRSPLAWTDALLQQAQRSLDGLYQALRPGDGQANGTASAYKKLAADEFPEPVVRTLLDDLNTPAALAALHGIATQLNKAAAGAEAQRQRRRLLAGGWLLGLLDRPANDWFQKARRFYTLKAGSSLNFTDETRQRSTRTAGSSFNPTDKIIIAPTQAAGDIDSARIEEQIARRNQARRERNFALADQIRRALAEQGIELEDSRAGTRWKQAPRPDAG